MTHEELVLNAALSSVNKNIARYISRVLDVDQGRTEYTRTLPEVQRELADELAEVEQLLRKTANGEGNSKGTVMHVIEGDTETCTPYDRAGP